MVAFGVLTIAACVIGITPARQAAAAAPDDKGADKQDKADCAAAYEQTQRLQQKSELLEALDSAERCARPSCPALLRDECSKWVTEIQPKVPSLVVRSRAGDGCVRSDAKIEVTGSRRGAEADVLLVDPGVHEIKVTDPVSGRTKTETINFAPGERRDIDMDFAPPDAVCGRPVTKISKTFKIPKLTLILGSIGGGLVVAGATVGIIGAVKRGDLEECKPCSSDRIDSVRTFFIAGDVLAGFGILALGAAAVTFFAQKDPKPTATTTSTHVFFAGNGVSGTF